MKKLEFWEIDAPDGLYVYDLDIAHRQAKATGTEFVTEAEVKKTFGKAATKRVVMLRPNNYTLRLAINKLLQKPDEAQGSKLAVADLNAEELAAIYAEAVIDSWNLGGEPNQENYLALDNTVRDWLTEKIAWYMAPDLSRNPDFFGIWNAKQTPRAASLTAATPTPTT